MSDDQRVLHVGIDLGTSRSSIAGSNDERHVVQSYVGWPADMVARKVLKQEVLVGDEALENRPMLDLYRPLEEGLIKKGSTRDEQAVGELLRHLLKLAGAEKGNGAPPVRAVVGVPAKALRVNKQSLRDAVAPLVDSLMIVSEPFAVAYGLDALLHAMIIDIGAGTADFCVMRGRMPTDEDQRTLTVAGDWVDEQLAGAIAEAHPDADFTIHMVREWKEKYSFVGEAKDKIKVTAPVDGRPTELDITDQVRSRLREPVAAGDRDHGRPAFPGRPGLPGPGEEQCHPLRWHGPDPGPRSPTPEGAGRDRRRPGQGGQGPGLRRRRRRPVDRHGRPRRGVGEAGGGVSGWGSGPDQAVGGSGPEPGAEERFGGQQFDRHAW